MKKEKALIIFMCCLIISLVFIRNAYGKKNDVGFIYFYEPDGNSFKQLLDDNGFHTNLIDINTITEGMLDSYKVIILGPQTGTGGTWRGTTEQISIINSTNLPIIGLGNGGYAFFGFNGLNLSIGYDLGGFVTSTVDFDVLNHSHEIFNIPSQIPDGIVQIYATGWYSDISIFLRQKCYYITLSNIPENVQVFGKLPESEDSYSLLNQDYRYFLWGFVQTPGYMNPTGENLFINIVNYYVPESETGSEGISGFNFFILIGVISVSILILFRQIEKKT